MASATSSKTVPAVACGTTVFYNDTKGHKKMAFVTGTPETVVEGTRLPTLNEGELHLTVVSPSGSIYNRRNVPFGAVPEAEAVEVPQSKIDLWTARIADRGYDEDEGKAYIERKSAAYIERASHKAPTGFWTAE